MRKTLFDFKRQQEMFFFVTVLDRFPCSCNSLGSFNLNKLGGEKPHEALGFGVVGGIKWRHSRRGGENVWREMQVYCLRYYIAQCCSSRKSHLLGVASCWLSDSLKLHETVAWKNSKVRF